VSRLPPDPEGVIAFCRALRPRLVGVRALHCGDGSVGDELAPETLARVWERWPAVRQMDSPEAWAFRVAFNLSASRFRRVAAERRARSRLGTPAAVANELDRASVVAVRESVASLPDRQRLAVVLRCSVCARSAPLLVATRA
jgi:RNA polymerase sigma-70 factor (ECF subfamily)